MGTEVHNPLDEISRAATGFVVLVYASENHVAYVFREVLEAHLSAGGILRPMALERPVDPCRIRAIANGQLFDLQSELSPDTAIAIVSTVNNLVGPKTLQQCVSYVEARIIAFSTANQQPICTIALTTREFGPTLERASEKAARAAAEQAAAEFFGRVVKVKDDEQN